MIPREILKKLQQIEIRTNNVVTDSGCARIAPKTSSHNLFPRARLNRKFNEGSGAMNAHKFTFRNRSALAMTETELKLMAAPAMMGLSSTPKNG